MKTIPVPTWEGITGESTALPAQIQAVLPGCCKLPRAALETDILMLPDKLPLVPTRRLIVLVPYGEIDEHALARRIQPLAVCSDLDVLYLILSPDADLVSYHRRRLAELTAMTIATTRIQVTFSVYESKSWSQVLAQILKPGDLIICLLQAHKAGLFSHQTLGRRLVADLNMPVYQLGDLQVESEPLSSGVKNILAWGTSLALLAVFFWLQVGMDRSPRSPQTVIMLCISVIVELFCLYKVNEWIG